MRAAPQPTGLRAQSGRVKLLGQPEIRMRSGTAAAMRCSVMTLRAVNATQSTVSWVAAATAAPAASSPAWCVARSRTAPARTGHSGWETAMLARSGMPSAVRPFWPASATTRSTDAQ